MDNRIPSDSVFDMLRKHPLLKKLTDRLLKILPYRPVRVAKEEWDSQYSLGKWDYLRQVGELAHYSVIAGYCHYFKPGGSFLDIGCGEGILQERLCYSGYSRYAGIDISEEAICLASGRQDEKTFFVRADVSGYCPDSKSDIIIFNECLYYFQDPMSVMKRYESFLTEDGLFIVSMFATEKTGRIWKILEESYIVQDEVFVKNRSGVSWNIKVLANPKNNRYKA